MRTGLVHQFPDIREKYREIRRYRALNWAGRPLRCRANSKTYARFPYARYQGNFLRRTGKQNRGNREFATVQLSKRPFLARLFCSSRATICSRPRFADGENEMADEHRAWKRQGEAFWRAHHEAWKRSDLNQRQYCEAHGLPHKAFENWRAEVQSRAAAARAQAALPPSPLKSSP